MEQTILQLAKRAGMGEVEIAELVNLAQHSSRSLHRGRTPLIARWCLL